MTTSQQKYPEDDNRFVPRRHSMHLVSQVITRISKGAGTGTTAEAWGISRRVVRSWVKAYDQGRLEILPHVHHWDIEPPDGPVSLGICRGCLEEKKFRNHQPGDSADYSRFRMPHPDGKRKK